MAVGRLVGWSVNCDQVSGDMIRFLSTQCVCVQLPCQSTDRGEYKSRTERADGARVVEKKVLAACLIGGGVFPAGLDTNGREGFRCDDGDEEDLQ